MKDIRGIIKEVLEEVISDDVVIGVKIYIMMKINVRLLS